jgi:hypothetical protein
VTIDSIVVFAVFTGNISITLSSFIGFVHSWYRMVSTLIAPLVKIDVSGKEKRTSTILGLEQFQ